MPKLLAKQFSAAKVHIDVDGYEEDNQLVLEFRIDSDCILHWGLTTQRDPAWQAPPRSAWPQATTLFGKDAVQSVCNAADGKPCTIRITLDLPCAWDSLAFVLYFPGENKWLKNGGGDFLVDLPRLRKGPSPQQAMEAMTTEGDWCRRDIKIDGGDYLAAGILEYKGGTRVLLACDSTGPLMLHWGLAGKFRHRWLLPSAEFRPPETIACAKTAVQYPVP